MNRYTGETLKNESDHIKQSIADILLTHVGSRIQRREYGSLIPMLIDRPISHTLLLQLAACASPQLIAGNHAYRSHNLNQNWLKGALWQVMSHAGNISNISKKTIFY